MFFWFLSISSRKRTGCCHRDLFCPIAGAALNIINRNKSIWWYVWTGHIKLTFRIGKSWPSGQQENDDVQAELTDDNLLDDVENQRDEVALLDDISRFPSHKNPILMPDWELNAIIKSFNQNCLFEI